MRLNKTECALMLLVMRFVGIFGQKLVDVIDRARRAARYLDKQKESLSAGHLMVLSTDLI